MKTKVPDIATMLAARHTLLWVYTREELRTERALIDIVSSRRSAPVLYFWDCVNGITDVKGAPAFSTSKDSADPSKLWPRILDVKEGDNIVWILRDPHPWMSSPGSVRQVKNLKRRLDDARARVSVICLSCSRDIPADLKDTITFLEWPLPSRSDVDAILRDTITATIEASPKVAARLRPILDDPRLREAAVDAAMGLTSQEVSDCFARSLTKTGTVDAQMVRNDKASVINASGLLEWYEPNPKGLDAIGGLGVYKDWLVERRSAFSPEARAFGIRAPRGVLVAGVPGTGKSLSAKCVPTAWGMPLIRLDLGALKSKYVGDSEANIRRALATVEAVSPCVLWCDEVEKSIGSGGSEADGGVTSDQLGALLTWLEERTGSVFAIFTANQAWLLPPELMRRFDEVFVTDLPSAKGRSEIACVALRDVGRDPKDFDIDAIAEATDRCTGAEVTRAVTDALFRAYVDGQRTLRTDDILNAARSVTRVADVSPDKIEALRTWAKTRGRPADRPDEVVVKQAKTTGRAVDIE